jgi:hypothetical protein
MKTCLFALLAIAPLALPLTGQATIKDALVKHWKTSGDLTIAVAKAMPADSYNFRPNPAEMSFGQLMAHIGVADMGACAVASGLTRPAFPPKIAAFTKDHTDVDRDTAIQFLTDTFDFCNKAVAAMTPERMETVEGPPERNLTGFEWLWSYFTHTRGGWHRSNWAGSIMSKT